MWLNLRQEGRYWDAAGLGGGQTLEFSAEAGKHGNNGLAGVSSARLACGRQDWICSSWRQHPSESRPQLLEFLGHLQDGMLGSAECLLPETLSSHRHCLTGLITITAVSWLRTLVSVIGFIDFLQNKKKFIL